MFSCEEFEFLSCTGSEALDTLSIKLEGLLERMQTPAARKGMEAAFNATPEVLGQAAANSPRSFSRRAKSASGAMTPRACGLKRD